MESEARKVRVFFLYITSQSLLRWEVRTFFGSWFDAASVLVFDVSKQKKKKFFRGLSNPRMRFKDFSLCELLNVSIKKKNNTAEGKRDTHTSKRFRFHCIAQKKKLHTIHTKVTRLQDPCESAINTAISCSWNSKVRRLTQSCNRKGRKLRHYSNRGIARETFTSTGSRCRGL